MQWSENKCMYGADVFTHISAAVTNVEAVSSDYIT